jgi:hypothetical protein
VRRAIAHPRLEVQRVVERDAIDPRSEQGLAAERLERVMDAHHHLLRDIFGLVREALTKDGGGEPEDLSSIPAHELGKRHLVSRNGLLDQDGVVGLAICVASGSVRQ